MAYASSEICLAPLFRRVPNPNANGLEGLTTTISCPPSHSKGSSQVRKCGFYGRDSEHPCSLRRGNTPRQQEALLTDVSQPTQDCVLFCHNGIDGFQPFNLLQRFIMGHDPLHPSSVHQGKEGCVPAPYAEV